MKFDYVIGNPPYQEETTDITTTNGQKSRKNIFHHFQIAADKISEKGSVLIYPAGRWIHQFGKGLKQFGLEQINDKTLSKLSYYPDARDIFGSAADLTDGVSIVVKNVNKKTSGFEYVHSLKGVEQSTMTANPGAELMVLNPDDAKISMKIREFVKNDNLKYLYDAILPRSLFAIESDFVSKNKDKVRPYQEGDSFDTEREIKLFTNDKPGSAGRSMWFVASKDIIETNQSYISEWQVVVSSAHPGGQDNRDNQLSIIDNHSAYGRARVGLRSFKTQKEALNFYKYMQTYFIRYALLLTDEALSSLGKLVPDIVDYSDNNKFLDFTKDLDKQLFELAKLDKQDIAYINSIIEKSGTRRME